MTTWVARDGDFEAVVTDLEPQIRAALSDAQRSIVDEVERETLQIFHTARELWPVGRRGAQRSRDQLYHRMVISGDTISGEVGCTAQYARYITSAQISSEGYMSQRAHAGVMHRNAALGGAPPPDREEVRETYRDRRSRAAKAAAHARRLGKSGSAAARSGSAMWLLLRWPERQAADRLEETLGPIIEAELAAELEG